MSNDVQIFYFAQLAEKLQCQNEFFPLTEAPTTISRLKAQLSERGEEWASQLSRANTRCAVNQAIATEDALLHYGDEVAFFPPMTGG